MSFLKPLLQAGVTTFVCLQGELPTSATSGQGSRSATFGSGGAISAKPYFEGALAMVRAGGYPLSATPERLSFVHYPMPATPGCVPEAGLLKQVVLDVLAFCAAGEYVYLHCSDGNGRSGTVAAAVLALAYGLGPTEALEHLATSRRHRHGSAGASPETHEQRMAVHKLLTVAPPAAAQTLPTHTRARPGSAAPQQPQPQQQQPAAAGLITASERAAITAAMAHGASRARSEFARHSDGASALSAAALRSLQGKLAALNSQRGGAYALASCKRAVVERLAGTALLPVPVPAVLGGRVCGRVARGGLGAVGEACGWFLTGEEEETLWRACLEVEGREGGGVEDEVGGEGGALPPPPAQQAPASYGRGGRGSGGSGGGGGGGAGSGAATPSSTPRLPTASSGPSVCLSTLFRVARGALSPAELPAPRLASITGAWERLWKAAYGSTEGSGGSGAQAVLPLATLAAVFSPATHPEVRANMRSAEAAQGDFLEAFALRRRAGSSSVGKGEFFAFYADVSHATPDESMFHSLMEGCWPAPHVVGSGGGSGYAGAGAQLPVAPGGLRGSSAQATAPPSIFLAAQAQAAAPEEVLRAHLARVCDASLPYLLYACRAADTDSDGCLRLEEWRCALQDTILHCTDAGGQLAHSAAPVGGEVFLRSRAAAVASGGQQPQGGALLGQGLHHMSAQLHPLLLTDTDATFIFNHLLSRCTRGQQQQQRSRQAQAQLLLPFAEACEVLRGPAASKPSRAALIASLYATLDSRKEGRVGMAAATAAFNAAAHPRCVAGRTNPALYSRIFRDSFVEGGQLVEAKGGESSRRLMGGPAGEAYYGSGDAGFVKESFFTEWCAGLSASYASPGEDGDFALTVSSLWSGKQLSRGGGAGLPVSAAASKCLENEEDLADIMGRMGSRGGPGARWSSAQVQGGGAASSSSSSSAMANPSSSPVRCSFAKEQRIGGEGRSKSMSGLLPGPASTAKTGQLRGAGLEASLSPARGGGGAPYLPSPASSMAASGSYSTSSASAAAAASGAPPSHYSAPSSAFCVNYPPTVQPILNEVMAVLQRRGVKASFRLLAALERVSGQTAQQQYPISLCEPAPISAVFACLRDAGCALDGGKLGALSQAFACDESASGVLCIPWEVLSAVHGGGLKGGRAAVVDKAWARICVQTAQGWGESPAGGQGIPTLADVRVLAEGLDESKVRSPALTDRLRSAQANTHTHTHTHNTLHTPYTSIAAQGRDWCRVRSPP